MFDKYKQIYRESARKDFVDARAILEYLRFVVIIAIVDKKIHKIDENRLYDLFDKKQRSNSFTTRYFDKLFAYRNELFEKNNFVKKLSN